MLRLTVFRAGAALLLALLCAVPRGPALAADSRVLHSLLDGVLETAVKDGYVDYPAIARNVRFYKYIEAIAEFDTASLASDAERLAFWINAYNALAIKAVIDGVTPVTMTGRLKFFRTIDHRVGGENLDLKSIVADKLAPLGEPRVHFALVPATFAAPKLRSEAYRADELERQLNENLRDFVNDKRKNRYSAVTQTAKLSTLFEEHAAEFGADDAAVLVFIARSIADEAVAKVLARGTYAIDYMEYDWSINGRPLD